MTHLKHVLNCPTAAHMFYFKGTNKSDFKLHKMFYVNVTTTTIILWPIPRVPLPQGGFLLDIWVERKNIILKFFAKLSFSNSRIERRVNKSFVRAPSTFRTFRLIKDFGNCLIHFFHLEPRPSLRKGLLVAFSLPSKISLRSMGWVKEWV